jgi:hypothetical protein
MGALIYYDLKGLSKPTPIGLIDAGEDLIVYAKFGSDAWYMSCFSDLEANSVGYKLSEHLTNSYGEYGISWFSRFHVK